MLYTSPIHFACQPLLTSIQWRCKFLGAYYRASYIPIIFSMHFFYTIEKYWNYLKHYKYKPLRCEHIIIRHHHHRQYYTILLILHRYINCKNDLELFYINKYEFDPSCKLYFNEKAEKYSKDPSFEVHWKL